MSRDILKTIKVMLCKSNDEILNGITEELAKMGITTSISDSELFDYESGIDKKLFISWE